MKFNKLLIEKVQEKLSKKGKRAAVFLSMMSSKKVKKIPKYFCYIYNRYGRKNNCFKCVLSSQKGNKINVP